MPSIELTEFTQLLPGPGEGAALLYSAFDDAAAVDKKAMAEAAARLNRSQRLTISERRHGLAVETRQYVGAVTVGPLRIVVRPKVIMRDLWHILAYAFDLDDLQRYDQTDFDLENATFADLLALALLLEGARLRRRLRRAYITRESWLESPRGAIALDTLVSRLPLRQAALPCRHHELTTDTLDNRIVRSGLVLARNKDCVASPGIRAALARGEAEWRELCGTLPLRRETFADARQRYTRLTEMYRPGHRLVELLWSGGGNEDEMEAGQDAMPGFLWDMNRLFERFVARFISEHLPEADVRTQEEVSIYGIAKDRIGRGAPRPRPDIVLRTNGQVAAVFDTKYRDLAAKKLPREMLYQLSIYSLAYSGPGRSVPSIILYPLASASAEDAALRFRHGHYGRESNIILRAVDWVAASQLMRAGKTAAAVELAKAWAAS